STTFTPGTMDPDASFTVTVIVPVSNWAGNSAANRKKPPKSSKTLFIFAGPPHGIFRTKSTTRQNAGQSAGDSVSIRYRRNVRIAILMLRQFKIIYFVNVLSFASLEGN